MFQKQTSGSNTSGFGAFGQQRAPTGTGHIKYKPVVDIEVVKSCDVNIKYHCITCMKKYKGKSLEEIRLEDYTAGRKGSTTGGMFTSFQLPTENKPLFGGTSFAQPDTTSGPLSGGGGLDISGFRQTSTGIFGAATTQTPTFGTITPSFGGFSIGTQNRGWRPTRPQVIVRQRIKPTTGFGSTPASRSFDGFGTGLFNAKPQKATAPIFRFTAPSGTDIFGAATTQTPTFGNTTPSFGGFGTNTRNQQSIGLVGAKPATTSFGITSASSSKPQQTTEPTFGSTAPSGTDIFGATTTQTPTFGTTTPSFCGFGTNTRNQQSTGLIGAKPATTSFGITPASSSKPQQTIEPTFEFTEPSGTDIFGATTTQTPTFGTTTPSFCGFGTNTPNQQSTGLVGAKPATTVFGITPASSSKPQQTTEPTFGSTAPSGTDIFGATTTQTPTFGTTTPSFCGFGTNTRNQQSTGLVGAKPTTTSFGITPTSSSKPQQTTEPTFGSTAPSGTDIFGATTTQTPTFGTTTPSFCGFGTNTRNQQSTGLVGAKPATTGFGITPASSSKPQQTTEPTFGSTAPSGTDIFGATTTQTPTFGTTTPSFCGFGTNTRNQQSTGLVGAKPTTTSFGITPTSSSKPQQTTEPTFGSTVPSGTDIFGATTTQTPTFGTTTPSFCGFGTNTRNQQSTGLVSAKPPTTSFGITSASKPQQITEPTFGPTAPSGTDIFGTATTQTPTFGTTTPTFCGFGTNTRNQQSTGLVGAKPATTSFGITSASSSKPQQTTKATFGSTAPSGTDIFGRRPTQTPTFGTTTPSFCGFGTNTRNQQSTGLVGAKPATTSFGITPASSSKPQETIEPTFEFTEPSGTDIFGATTTQTPTFGTTTPSFCGFGTNTRNQQSTGLVGAKPTTTSFGITPTSSSKPQQTTEPTFGSTAPSGTDIFGRRPTQTPTFGTTTPSFCGFGTNTRNQQSTGLVGAKPATTSFGITPASSSKPQETIEPTFEFTEPSGTDIFGATTTQTPTFGTTTPSFCGFGTNTRNQQSTGLVGAKPTTTSFGITPTSSSKPQQTTEPTFGSTAPSGTDIFGAATTQTPTFGTTTPSFGGFCTNTRNQQSTGLVGAKPSTTSFGITPASSSKPHQTTEPTFGSTAPSAPRISCISGTPNNLPPLSFHAVHGENVRISRDGSTARRVESFCEGITFSARPVRVNEKVCVRLVEISYIWNGAISLGFTTHDPTTLAHALLKHIGPDFTYEPGIWAKMLEERFCEKDNILYYYVNSAGDVHFGINGEYKGLFFFGVDTKSPLWALIDVYAKCTAVQFADPRALNQRRRFTQSPLVEDDTFIGGMRSLSVEEALPPPRCQNPLAPLSLHRTKGRNVHFVNDRGIAARIEAEFCQGYVFTARPMRLGQTIVVQILAEVSGFVGSLAIGLTSCDPDTLRPCDLPNNAEELVDRPEYWVVKRNAAHGLGRGDELAVTLTVDGEVRVRRNLSNPVTVMHVDHTVRLWAFVDLFGKTQKVRILSSQILPAQTSPQQLRVLAGSAAPITRGAYGTVLAFNPPPPTNIEPIQASSQLCLAGPRQDIQCSSTSQNNSNEQVQIPDRQGFKGIPNGPSTSCQMSSSSHHQPIYSVIEEELTGECTICCENPVDSVLYMCGHMCMCYRCAKQQWRGIGNGRCPVCRAKINDVIRTYKS